MVLSVADVLPTDTPGEWAALAALDSGQLEVPVGVAPARVRAGAAAVYACEVDL